MHGHFSKYAIDSYENETKFLKTTSNRSNTEQGVRQGAGLETRGY